MYIDTQEGLREFLQIGSDAPFITVDTEFLREKTYHPQLCLIQIATEKLDAVIDPLAPLDLTMLAPLFTDEKVVKVFHAGDQDRAILYNLIGTPVRPVFDTQRAALLLGLPQQISLAGLVKHYCDVTLKKESSYSDWSQRPLTPEQISYAFEDVHYLPSIYKKMVAKLTENGRLIWLKEDFASMEEESAYKVEPRDIWKKLRGTMSLKGRQLAVARELAAWREETAIQRNLPRKWVLADEFIVEIAKREPDSAEALYRIRGIRDRLGQKWVHEVLEAIAAARALPESAWPKRERSSFNRAAGTAKLDMITTLLHHRSKELHIASSFIASHDDLERLASGQGEDIALMRGWRRELIGDELMRLLAGELLLSLDGDDLKVTFAEQADEANAR